MMLTLEVKPREDKKSAEILRSEGFVPAVFYGPKEKNTPIAIDASTFLSTWKQAGETTIVSLRGVGDAVDTLIREVQVHPVTGTVLHVDFYALEKGKKVTINVPLEFEGVAPAEKEGHIISKAVHEIEIEVAPQELPHSLSVDLTTLVSVGDHITAKDITLPPSAVLLSDAEEIIASVTEFHEEKEPEPAAPAEGEAAPEVPAEGEPAPEGEKAE
jgi:large subunit ribosomal protein L25